MTMLQRRLQGGAVILEARKPAGVVAVAVAKKTVRFVWAVLPDMLATGSGIPAHPSPLITFGSDPDVAQCFPSNALESWLGRGRLPIFSSSICSA